MQRKVARFLKEMKWDKASKDKLIGFIKKDSKELNSRNAKHKVIDIYFETIQLSNKMKLNMKRELEKHMKDARKKYGR